ncbi:thioesterase family protein [Sulfuritalea sp.]|uniref:acyl-CoA thioesterase n=1 Tax=Sulfuritalea sp. TaxID=2480090 RepID=UPI001AC238E0|nr:thioesterase family protein [Sulfuritalea sp.]MBN8477096.1 acyl-CoA thioesterase [Sulfuritalea sp.]
MPCQASSTLFEREVLIRFSHCDPGGIVFYPQYFILMNGLVEDWFTEGLDINFADLVMSRRIGIPTVRMDCTFSRPSYIGERLMLGLTVTKIGSSSFWLRVQASAGSEIRIQASQALVTADLDGIKPIAIPADLRSALMRYQLQP